MRTGLLCAVASWLGFCIGHTAAVVNGKDLSECAVDVVDERRRGAEVGAELDGVEAQRQVAGNFETKLFDARE